MSLELSIARTLKCTVLCLFIGFFTFQSKAQGIKNSLGLYQVLSDNNVILTDNEYFKFDTALSHFTRLEYQRKLSKSWSLSTGFTNGFIEGRTLRENYIKKSLLLGLDGSIQLELNKGRHLQGEPFFSPFISFGYRVDYIKDFKDLGVSPWFYQNQYGVGLNIRITERTRFQMQGAIDQRLQDDYNTSLQYRVGFNFSLGKAEQSFKDVNQTDDAFNTFTDTSSERHSVNQRLYGLENDKLTITNDSLIDKLSELEKKNSQLLNENNDLKEKLDSVVAKLPKELQPKHYYVIIFSGTSRKGVERALEKKKEIFNEAVVLPQRNGTYRIGIPTGKDKTESLVLLDEVRSNYVRSAWLSIE